MQAKDKKASKEKVVFCYYLPKGGSLLQNNFSPIHTSTGANSYSKLFL
jgi:hypothetical protein